MCRAILALLEPDETHHWRADGTVCTVPFEGGEVLISIHDESGKIDLNQAPPELLRGLFISIGLDELEADALGTREIDSDAWIALYIPEVSESGNVTTCVTP